MAEDKGLEALQVWQKAMAFTIRLQREILPLLPVEEKWSLASQIRRAAQSIPTNIAEGYGRFYYQEGIHYCYYARGSLEEVFTQICLAHKLDYISQDTFNNINRDIEDIRRLLNGYIQYLRKNKHGEKDPGNLYQIHDESLADYSGIDNEEESNMNKSL